MALPLSTARAAKSMPGHYGHSKKKAGAKKAASKKAPARGAKTAKKPAAAGTKAKKGLPPAFLKNMKKKSSKK